MDDGSGSLLGNLISLGVMVLVLAGYWAIFTKAGEPGWAILVPFYNVYVQLKIAGKPGWWLILLFLPLVNLIVIFAMFIGIAHAFGKSTLYGLGMIFLPFIFVPMLGLGADQYQGNKY